MRVNHSELRAPMRNDEVIEGNDPEGVLMNTKGRRGLYYSVPKLIE